VTEEMKGQRDFGRIGVGDLTAAAKTLVVGELMGPHLSEIGKAAAGRGRTTPDGPGDFA